MATNKRFFQGTIPSLTPGVKIGGDFELQAGGTAQFIAERLELFYTLKAEKESEPREKAPIVVEVGEGRIIEGVAFETTPAMIAQQVGRKGCVVARLCLKDAKTGPKVVDALDEMVEDDDVAAEDEDDKFVLWDLHRPLEASCSLQLFAFGESPLVDGVFWHSSAHLLGLVLEDLYGAKLCVGPSLANGGFYYDFYVGDKLTITPADYDKIVSRAQQIVALAAASKKPKNEEEAAFDSRFERLMITKEEAKLMFKDNPFKLAIIDSKVPEDGFTTVYRCGRFIDLCMGPHIPDLSYIKAFAVEKHSAAYWLGDAKGDSLQRVYGISFPDNKLMKEHIKRIEEAKKRDHRVLGQKLGYFFFEPIYSPGCAFWTPMGANIYNKLCNFIRAEYRHRGFSEVITPNACSSELFKVSGHWQNYKDCMFCLDVEGKQWALKPMNCPTHCCIFKHMKLSYKQLPIRMADFAALHRNEFSGSLTGLTRVRRFQQDDAHIFCAMEQVQKEVADALDFLQHVYQVFGFTFKIVLATRPKKALGSIELWQEAEGQLAEALNKSGIPWSLNKGDGAFYGPKIDIKLFDALGRAHQCGTIQLDFQLPIRFDLQYKTSENFERKEEECETPAGEKPADDKTVDATAAETPARPAIVPPTKEVEGSLETEVKPGFARPVMIHRAILGSVERMTAILLEHYAGKLPFWLSPRQALVCPISEKTAEYAKSVKDVLVSLGFDVDADLSNTTINKKIREASVYYWNYMLVVGEKEQKDMTIAVRCRESPQQQTIMRLPEVVALFERLRNVGRPNAELTILERFNAHWEGQNLA